MIARQYRWNIFMLGLREREREYRAHIQNDEELVDCIGNMAKANTHIHTQIHRAQPAKCCKNNTTWDQQRMTMTTTGPTDERRWRSIQSSTQRAVPQLFSAIRFLLSTQYLNGVNFLFEVDIKQVASYNKSSLFRIKGKMQSFPLKFKLCVVDVVEWNQACHVLRIVS